MRNIIFSFAVGASTSDKDGLRYLYEGDEKFAPLPTFGVLLTQEAFTQSHMMTGGMPGFQFDLSRVCTRNAQRCLQLADIVCLIVFRYCMESSISRFTKISQLMEL